MEIDLNSVITTAIGIIGLMGGMIIRDRQVTKAINDGDAELHRRVNRIQEHYVRRDDLDKHLESIETLVGTIRDEQRETTRRIDEVLRSMNNNK